MGECARVEVDERRSRKGVRSLGTPTITCIGLGHYSIEKFHDIMLRDISRLHGADVRRNVAPQHDLVVAKCTNALVGPAVPLDPVLDDLGECFGFLPLLGGAARCSFEVWRASSRLMAAKAPSVQRHSFASHFLR